MASSSDIIHSLLKKRLFSGGLWAIAGSMLTALMGLIVNALLSRLLTPEEFGAYFLTFSFATVSMLLARLGLGAAVVRLIAESIGLNNLGRARAIIKKIFILATIGILLVCTIIAMGFGQWLSLELMKSSLMYSVIGLVPILIAINTYRSLIAETFRGFHDIKFASIFNGLISSIFSALFFAVLWIVWGHSNLKEILLLSIVAGAMSTLMSFFVLTRKIQTLENDGKVRIKEILAISSPLLVVNLALYVFTQADIWVIGAFRSQEDVAVYGAAVRLVQLVAMPLLIVNSVVPPVIAELFAQGKKEELEKILQKTASIACLPTFVILVIYFLFSGPILSLVYGDFYYQGASVILILSFGQLVSVWAGSCGLTLMMSGYQTIMMGITLFSGFVTMALNLFVVNRYGVTGVAGATAFGWGLQNIIMLLTVRYKVGIWTNADSRSLRSIIQDIRLTND
ncbi:flippase [Thermodesulfobacteriota bacterium]